MAETNPSSDVAPEDDTERREAIYAALRDEIRKRSLSNTENFDRSILTISSAALGLSLTFIKNIVALETAIHVWMLAAAWSLFVLAILVTLASFLLSQRGLALQDEYAQQYYLHRKDEYLNKDNQFANLTQAATYVSGASFVLAFVTLVLFVFVNISHERSRMKLPDKIEGGAAVPTNMQPVIGPREERGAEVPSMQPVPSGPNASGGSNAGGSTGTSGGNSANSHKS